MTSEKWQSHSPGEIVWDAIGYDEKDLKKHRSWFAACILFFYDDALPDQHPAVNNALHAGWQIIHNKPMDAEALEAVPVEYDEEEQLWCKTSTKFLVSRLTTEGRANRGLSPLPAARGARTKAGAQAALAGGKLKPAPVASPADHSVDDDDDELEEVHSSKNTR